MPDVTTADDALDGPGSVDWAAVTHAYGSAQDVPDLLRAVAAGDAEALDALYGTVWHQGTVYEATAPAVRDLIRILGVEGVDAAGVLRLLGAIADGSSFAEEHGDVLVRFGTAGAAEVAARAVTERAWAEAAGLKLSMSDDTLSAMVILRPSPRAFVRAFAVMLAAAAVVVPATAALAAPTFKVPFPCGQVWSGQTRSDHSPANAVDFNRDGDDGDPVVASASGTVDRVTDLGDTSYGRYVRIDHGGGYTTYYAHLSRFNVSVGQTVRYGQVIGYVGTTGGSTGPHLHYEQRSGGTAVKVRFNGTQALYWGTRNYTSDNGCPSSSGHGTVNTSGTPLTVRSGPSTASPSVGTLADGAGVTIACQTTGTTVDGTYGTSNIWDRIGTGRYIADAYVLTGYDGYIPGVPRC